MDKYGSMRIDQESADQVRNALDEFGSVVFAFSGDQMGSLIILLCRDFEKLGVMPFGGKPDGRIYLGLYGRGCNHFSMEPIHPNYFKEKLDLADEEAEWLSQFWDLLWNRS
jgi:hypothetical protein